MQEHKPLLVQLVPTSRQPWPNIAKIWAARYPDRESRAYTATEGSEAFKLNPEGPIIAHGLCCIRQAVLLWPDSEVIGVIHSFNEITPEVNKFLEIFRDRLVLVAVSQKVLAGFPKGTLLKTAVSPNDVTAYFGVTVSSSSVLKPPPPNGPERKSIICVGRLHPEKGFATLIRAVALASPDAVINIFGDGWEKPNLLAMAKKLHVNLRLRSRNPDIREDLLKYEVFCQPSLVDPDPLSLLEAVFAKSQYPQFEVIASDACGYFDRMDVNPAVRSFPAGDYNALASVLYKLWEI